MSWIDNDTLTRDKKRVETKLAVFVDHGVVITFQFPMNEFSKMKYLCAFCS